MNRPYLFLAGEISVSMPLCFSRRLWSHSMLPKKLILNEDNTISRLGMNEKINGVIYYNRTQNYELEITNLDFLIRNKHIKCWPNPALLRELSDRHAVLKKCLDAGFINHLVVQGDMEALNTIEIERTMVIKTEQGHGGQGKFLIQPGEKLPKWGGVASMEPFFSGDSCRVLLIGDDSFFIKYDNPNSWIKNSLGGDITKVTKNTPKELLKHAKKVSTHFGLEISGVDYIINEHNFNFLEINQYPGLGVSDDIMDSAKTFLSKKMDLIESF